MRKPAILASAAVAASALAFAGVAGASSSAPQAPKADKNIVQTAVGAKQFTTLVALVKKAGLVSALSGKGPLTVFAPTDAAFAALPAGELDRLMKDPAALQRLLVYHLINTPIDSARLAGAKGPVNTVAGSGLVLDGSGQGLKANTANILAFDVKTTSGVLFVVDAVLTPEGAAAAMAEPALDVPAETAPTAP